MMRNWRKKLGALVALAALSVLAARTGHSQDKPKDPKVVLDLEKPAASDNSAANAPAPGKASLPPSAIPPFGKTCSAFGTAKDGYRSLDEPASIAELIGAPVEIVRVRRFGAARDKIDKDEVRKRIAQILSAQISEEYRYQPWDQAASADLVATIQFYDHTAGVLEASANHACFSDYAGLVWWVRTAPTPQTK